MDLAVARTGSIVWIGDWDADSNNATGGGADDRQVRKLEPGAPAGGTIVDSGLEIDPSSLALGSRATGGS